MKNIEETQNIDNKRTNDSLIAVTVENYDLYRDIESSDHYHSYHLVVLVTEGKGTISVSGSDFCFECGDIVMLPQNILHSVKWAENLSAKIVNFNEEMLMNLPMEIKQVIDYNLLIRKGFRVFSPNKTSFYDLTRLYAALEREYNTADNARYHTEATNALFTAFVATVIRSVNQETLLKVVEDSMFSEMIKLIEMNYKAHLKVNDYAMMLGVSAKTLERHVIKIAGTTPQKMIAQKLTSEAKMILRSTKIPIKQVALELGFCDIAHFTNFFKKNAGMTPTSFRNCNSPFSKDKII